WRLREVLAGLTVDNERFAITEGARSFHAGEDPRVNVLRLRNCATAFEATELHRLSAARQLLMIAEITLDRSLAEFAYEATRDIAPGTSSQMMTSLLYHTCFGDAGEATEIAAQLA